MITLEVIYSAQLKKQNGCRNLKLFGRNHR